MKPLLFLRACFSNFGYNPVVLPAQAWKLRLIREADKYQLGRSSTTGYNKRNGIPLEATKRDVGASSNEHRQVPFKGLVVHIRSL